jgi:adenylate cyclase
MFRKPVKQKRSEIQKDNPGKAVTEVLNRNRKAFISYNIEQIREFIRYLSPEKYELFYTIPFLLHVNAPDFPGYIDHPLSAYGIYGFHDSGFWKEALRHFKFREKDLQPNLASTYIINGLYLIGSIETLGNKEFSDFGYWVVVNEKKITKPLFHLLKRKLDKISEWSLEEYNQAITFCILTDEEIRHGNVPDASEGSLETAKMTILKEELYRTFIMIAGKVPVWAVLPSGLDDETYKDLAKYNSRLSFDPYIDLGNLTSIANNECPGAILLELFNARYDPMTSFVKASLIASYYYQKNETLPCDLVKKRFTDSLLAGSVMAPCAIIFDRILEFYQGRKDNESHELIKKSIFLSLYGYSLIKEHDDDVPKTKLLSDYVSKWKWDEGKTDSLKIYNQWPEKKKREFDEEIIDSIIELYRQVAIEMVNNRKSFAMHPSDLQTMKHKISALFQEKKKKIPTCSAYLKAKARSKRLKILCRRDKEKEEKWSCYEYVEAGHPYDDSSCIFRADEVLHTIGWIISNHLTGNNPNAVIFEDETGESVSCLADLFHEVIQFMPESDNSCSNFITMDPEFTRLFIAVEGKNKGESLETGSMLIQNSWNEIFFTHLTIKHIENMMLQCYKIGKIVSNFYQKSPSRNLQYSVFHNNADDNDYVSKTVTEFVNQFKHDMSEKDKTDDAEIEHNELEENRPFLDTLTF